MANRVHLVNTALLGERLQPMIRSCLLLWPTSPVVGVVIASSSLDGHIALPWTAGGKVENRDLEDGVVLLVPAQRARRTRTAPAAHGIFRGRRGISRANVLTAPLAGPGRSGDRCWIDRPPSWSHLCTAFRTHGSVAPSPCALRAWARGARSADAVGLRHGRAPVVRVAAIPGLQTGGAHDVATGGTV